ncbi:hypothetical protein AA101099_1785 [Neoasaia chiangmaiensis NBRC 101099]|uniref:Uncharacterized protein n=1 Tax=Neoasaia chiangmaiensis TaxID=320497 RepID=A0A1U9KRF7_9PROT|nr:hypothetical protein [Neoasaia chiangmaiensis]AQS88260.1 hypothetical protein A0U93_10265 [Neoasaia chiangmaiensis]GBR39712.1 hypothetical protein AA101099_1785 [Neoasaia chiangmaiensis NBRC 101099]GEN14707.1 hypothetical protein NCH01_11380 [Neoasaia chiangmaiensis]
MSAPAATGVSIREFARLAGCDDKQVRRAIEKGRIQRFSDGSIDPAQVDGDWRRATRRGADNRADNLVKRSADKPKVSAPAKRRKVSAPAKDETPAEAAERIVKEAGGDLLPLNAAICLKENFAARLKQLEYDQKAGKVVDVALIAKKVGEEYARVRTRLLAIPAEQAPTLHRFKTVTELQDRLLNLIIRALEELTADGDAAS